MLCSRMRIRVGRITGTGEIGVNSVGLWGAYQCSSEGMLVAQPTATLTDRLDPSTLLPPMAAAAHLANIDDVDGHPQPPQEPGMFEDMWAG